ncbi:MAG: hypothetical protein CYPHOPRED_002032 [Cyphobasidiales sp. Tagirdzhanova-0007]|nr:MAG: hypothetical protein CYPHOPRED_002032 [Cyphobasidiales sp. Tagirdzhanova-0007]
MTDYSGEFVQGAVEEAGVLHLQMRRAPVNASNAQLFFEIGNVFELARSDPNVRAIVISSAFPKFFTAGLDLKDISSFDANNSDPARKALKLQEHLAGWQSVLTLIEQTNKPAIVAVAGVAFGFAIDLCCACDIRYASSDATFSIKEVDVGLAADLGTLSRLPKIIGNDSLARELAFTARTFSAQEAMKMGFISRILDGGHRDVVDAALATARIIATKSPIAVLGTKHLLNYSRDHTVAEGLHYTSLWNSVMLQTQDLPEAMGAFLQKKKPRFSNL